MKKKLIAVILAFVFTSSAASASILGSQLIDSSSILFARNTTLYNNTFVSDQSGVGLQTEYYAEYTPNPDSRPIVVTGESIWGKRTITQAIDYMESNNMYPMIGINASFFSFQTGVPMGHVITNGEITSKDATELDAVGFYEDGNAFISRLGITTTGYFSGYEFDIAHINKYCQATTDVMTLYTDDFGSTTHADPETINVVLGNIQGKLAIGQELTGTVEEIKTVSGAVDIPEGKIVLTIKTSGNAWITSLMNLLTVGETMTIKNEATTDAERWNLVYNGLASEGKRLLENGNVASGLEAGAAPRTAVGITSNGNVLFYVIDGRQNGYSYGVKQTTLAERLKELGCVDALNLDGGGSTSIAGIYPGQDAASIINSPSDGALRSVTNFIFIQNTQEPTDTLGGLYLYPHTGQYLSGSTVQLYPAAVDSAFHTMPVPEVTYSMGNEFGSVTQDGVLTLSGTGQAIVNVSSGDITGGTSYSTYETPTSFSLYNIETGEKVTSINAAANSVFYLGGHAYNGQKYLTSTPNAYHWQLDPELGTVKDGVLQLSYASGASGNLTVWAGDTVVTIPVSINSSVAQDPAERYPYSETRVYNDKITVDMFSYNEHIDFDNSYVKVDGQIWSDADDVQKYEVDDRHGVIVIPVDGTFEQGYHKIFVKTQTTDGFASVQSTEVTNAELQNNFADTGEHWARDIISYMNLQNIVNGSEDNGNLMFYPDNNMTRAEFAVMICNYLGVDTSVYANEEILFNDKDIIPGWAANYIKAAADAGIISGKQVGEQILFAPNDQITRAEAASIIGRTLPDNLRSSSLNFSDASSIPQWARTDMAVMNNAGFLNGYPDNTIRPNGNVTRAEAVAMLYNAY